MAFFQIPANPKIVEVSNYSSRPYVAGFELTITGLTTMTLLPGCARAVDKPENIFYPPINANAPGVITVDVSTVFAPAGLDANGVPVPGTAVGFGGCFPFTLDQAGMAGNDTVFPLLAIGDSTGKLSTTIIVPTSGAFLPAGYDSFARVGQVYIDGGTFNIIPFQQTGHYEIREYVLNNAVSVLSGGASQTAALIDLTAGDNPIVPGTAEVSFRSLWVPAAAADTSSLNPTGVTSTTHPVVLQNSAALGAQENWKLAPAIDVATGDAGIDYINSAAAGALSVWVTGWTDDMGVSLRFGTNV